jgi:tRNA dimethylallyltransferase
MWKTIFITGPTASGKSNLAIYLAKKLQGEIINADSRQVYKNLDVGSGKWDVGKKVKIRKSKDTIQIDGVFHHLLSIAHPKRNYSLGRWLRDAHKAVRKITKKGKVPIFCGGTILYLRAIKEGWVLPSVKPNYKLRKELEKKTNKELYEKIKKFDPQRAKNLDQRNKRRLIRALEIMYVLGKVPKIKKEPKYEVLIIAPRIDKAKLFKKNKRRLLKRVPGIIKEIKKLRRIGLSYKRIIDFGLEYKWFGLYVSQIEPARLRAPALNLLQQQVGTSTSQHFCPAPIQNMVLGPSQKRLRNVLYGVVFNKHIPKQVFINLCYKDILRFAKRQIRELRKIEEVTYVENKKEATKVVENFLKK